MSTGGTTTDKVIIQVEIDKENSKEELQNVVNNIQNLTRARETLTATNKELAKSGEQLSAEYLTNTKNLELNKAEIDKQNKVKQALIQVIKSEENSITSLTAKNKLLTEERNRLNTSTEEGKKRIQAINKEVDANNKTIKDNVSGLEKQRLNIGNYSSALDKLVPGLGKFSQGLADGGEGMKSLTVQTLKFLATPIGLIIAAIVVALAALSQYFTSTEEGGDKLAKVMAQLHAIFTVLQDRLIRVGKALADILSGNFVDGVKGLTTAFDGMADSIVDNVRAAGELAEAIDALEDRELAYGIAVSKTTNEIKLLIIQSKNAKATEKERQDALDKAESLESARIKDRLSLTEQAIANKTKEFKVELDRLGLVKLVGETELNFADRVAVNVNVSLAKRKELSELLIKYNSEQGESLNLIEKIQNKQDAADQRRLANLEKIKQEQKKAHDEQQKLLAEQDEIALAALTHRLNKEHDVYQKALDEKQKMLETNNKAGEKYIENALKEREKREKDEAEKRANTEARIERFKYDSINALARSSFGKKKELGYLLNALAKTNAIKETVMNTYAAAMAVYKSAGNIPYVGWILAPVAAAAAVALGAAQVANIVGIQFAKGGRVNKSGTFDGPSHSGGGIDYIRSDGKHRINVEGGENFYVLNKSASREINALSRANVKHGGVDFSNKVQRAEFGGQIETRQASNSAQDSNNVSDIVRVVLESAQLVVGVGDIIEGIDKKNSVRRKATVIS